MFRATQRTAAAEVLPRLLASVSHRHTPLEPDDVYRICALMKGNSDVLGLKAQTAFVAELARQYRGFPPDAMSPFQKTLVDSVLPARDFSPEAANAAVEEETVTPAEQSEAEAGASFSTGRAEHSPAPRQTDNDAARSSVSCTANGEPGGMERLAAVWELIQEAQESQSVSKNTLDSIEVHVRAIEPLLRQLSPAATSSLIKALAVVNYQVYEHTTLLSRRGCEVAGQLPRSELCRLYHNLHRLNTRDSLQPVVNGILQHINELTVEEVQFVTQALEHQTNPSSAGARLITPIAARALQLLSTTNDATYHRAVLAAMARYGVRNYLIVNAFLRDVSRVETAASDWDIMVILKAAIDLHVPAASGVYDGLLTLVEKRVATTDVRNIDTLMDTLSMLPVDSSTAMQLLMTRLETDAGKLHIPHLTEVLRLLSTYPPARGQVCIVSLGFAAALRADSIEAGLLEDITVSLALLGHFTDDFFTITETLLKKKKGGLRTFENVEVLLQHCPAEVAASERGQALLAEVVLSQAPSMTEAQLLQCRRLLGRLGVANPQLQQRLTARATQLERNASVSNRRHSSRRRPYDPMGDLL